MQSYVPGARPARIPLHIIIINFDERAESSLMYFSYSINYIVLQLLLWLAALYTLSRLVFQVALSLLLAFEITLEISTVERSSSRMLHRGRELLW